MEIRAEGMKQPLPTWEVQSMAKPSGDELVKYITEKVVVYMEDPRAVHARRKAEKQPWAEKWFGTLPLAWSLWRRKWSRGRRE